MIGSSHRRRAKSPLGTVLIINLLEKGLTPREMVWEMEAPFDGLLVITITPRKDIRYCIFINIF